MTYSVVAIHENGETVSGPRRIPRDQASRFAEELCRSAETARPTDGLHRVVGVEVRPDPDWDTAEVERVYRVAAGLGTFDGVGLASALGAQTSVASPPVTPALTAWLEHRVLESGMGVRDGDGLRLLAGPLLLRSMVAQGCSLFVAVRGYTLGGTHCLATGLMMSPDHCSDLQDGGDDSLEGWFWFSREQTPESAPVRRVSPDGHVVEVPLCLEWSDAVHWVYVQQAIRTWRVAREAAPARLVDSRAVTVLD